MGKDTRSGKGPEPTPASPYQERILAHSRQPSHMGARAHVAFRTHTNALCGDQVTVFFGGSPKSIEPLFEATGCALCRASASILMDQVHGSTLDAALRKVRHFLEMFEQEGAEASEDTEDQDLAALRDMRRFASRAKCVLLPWDAMLDLLAGNP